MICIDVVGEKDLIDWYYKQFKGDCRAILNNKKLEIAEDANGLSKPEIAARLKNTRSNEAENEFGREEDNRLYEQRLKERGYHLKKGNGVHTWSYGFVEKCGKCHKGISHKAH